MNHNDYLYRYLQLGSWIISINPLRGFGLQLRISFRPGFLLSFYVAPGLYLIFGLFLNYPTPCDFWSFLFSLPQRVRLTFTMFAVGTVTPLERERVWASYRSWDALPKRPGGIIRWPSRYSSRYSYSLIATRQGRYKTILGVPFEFYKWNSLI